MTIPDLQRLASYAVQYRQEAGLKGVLEHLSPFSVSSSHHSTPTEPTRRDSPPQPLQWLYLRLLIACEVLPSSLLPTALLSKIPLAPLPACQLGNASVFQ